jgi:trk system potassium uptake protein TrkH
MSSESIAGERRAYLPVRFAPIFYILGIILVLNGISMMLPALIDFLAGNGGYRYFLFCSALTIFIGGGLFFASRGSARPLDPAETFLMLPLVWLSVAATGALPFLLSEFQLGYTDAFFETMSGLTTTGASVIVGLDEATAGILFWRFMLQWAGGFGVVTLAVLFLPMLRIGGMQLFQLELGVQTTKLLPTWAAVVSRIAAVYVGLTGVTALALYLAGMSGFDAIGHAMAALATGGFSSHDANIGYFQSPLIEWILVLAMFCGALPFVLYVAALRGQPLTLLNDSQVRLFAATVFAAIALLTVWRIVGFAVAPAEALRQAAFVFVSLITSTGFTSYDYVLWGGFPVLLLLVAMFLGGCTGSTAGGIKMFRLHILFSSIQAQMRRQLYPHSAFAASYNQKPVPDAVRAGVTNYFFIYLASFFALALALGLTGLDFTTSLGGSATALGNVGPGLDSVIGPCCTFRPLPDAAKWLLSLGMLAGRLEILILVIPFTRAFWRR